MMIEFPLIDHSTQAFIDLKKLQNNIEAFGSNSQRKIVNWTIEQYETQIVISALFASKQAYNQYENSVLE